MAITLSYDLIPDGGLVAMHTHDGRTVAAVVHPPAYGEQHVGSPLRWVLAGDLDRTARPSGEASLVEIACGQAALALGVELGVVVDGWDVPQ